MATRTSSSESDCPSAIELQQFLFGQPCANADILERHLLECPRCSEAASSISSEDPLITAMRRSTLVVRDEVVDTLVTDLVTRMTRPNGTDRLGSADETSNLRLGAGNAHAAGGSPEHVAALAGPNSSSTFPFLAPPEAANEIGRLGGFRVLEQMGAGGMGIVFRAEDTRLVREVALKVIKPERLADPDSRQRFLREARAAAAIAHEHVVAVHQVGESGGVPFLVMPLLEGESLQDRLDREGRLTVPEVVRIGREIAEGLQAAHEKGLIHRDIKPGNVWLEYPRGKVKVLDFGLARPEQDAARMTASGMLVGTPAFMAPEQLEQAVTAPERASGETIDARADLFAFGCMLYTMLSGQPPFQGPHVLAVLNAVLTHQPPPPRQLNPEVPPPLSDLVMRLLAKRREDRPASARDVVATLCEIERSDDRADEPRQARRSGRWVALAAGLLGLAAVTAGVVITIRDPNKPNEPPTRVEAPDGSITKVDEKGNIDITLPGKQKPSVQPVPPAPALKQLSAKDITVAVLGNGPRHDAHAYAVAISPDSKWIASGSSASDVRLWEARTLRLRPPTLKGANGHVRVMAFAPDGKTLVAAVYMWASNQLLVWDLSRTKLEDPNAEILDPTVQLLPTGREDMVQEIVFNRDSKWFATVHHDQARVAPGDAVRLWELSEGRLIQRERLSEHKDKPICVAFSPEGDLLASGGQDGSVRLYRLANGKPTFLHSLGEQHKDGATAVAFNPKGKSLATAAGDGILRLWRLGEKPTLICSKKDPGMPGWAGPPGIGSERYGPLLAFAPDGKSLAYGGSGTTRNPLALGLLDLANPERPVVMPVTGFHAFPLRSLAFAADGKTVVTTHEECSLFLVWDVTPKGLVPRRLPGGSLARMRQVAFSPDGKTLAASGLDAKKGLSVFLWDWQGDNDGKAVVHSNVHGGDIPVKGLTGEFSDYGGARFPWMAFLPGGRALATVNYYDRKLRVWSLEKDGPRVQYVRDNGEGSRVSASRDGQWLASGEFEGVRLWAV